MKLQWYHAVILILAALLLVAAAALVSGSNAPADRESLYQVSALELLANGSYDGLASVGDVRQHGDFGLGTFDRLNGEAIVLDGGVYQVKSDGTVNAVNDSTRVPFAAVTYFDADASVHLIGPVNLSSLTANLDDRLPSKNIFYAIRIHGAFPYVKTRSVPMQDKPYPPLTEVIKDQSVFELHNVTGTLVGIYSPRFTNGVESPGYHFHFLSDDRTSGGHVLDLTAGDLDVWLDETPRLSLGLSPAC